MSEEQPPEATPPQAAPPQAAPPQAAPPPVGTVTADASGRRWYWDGVQWRPAAGSRRRNLRWLWTLAIVVVVGIGYAVFGNHGSTQTISNTKIDSSTQIEFDFHASTNCSNLTFSYVFYDSSGTQVDSWEGSTSHTSQSGHDYHVTATADASTGQSIPSSATRFDVTPTCHDQ